MQTVIIVIHLMVVLALIGAVLLQRSEGGGLGMGGSGSNFLSSRGTANLLTRTTGILAALFFVTSLTLSIMAGVGRKPASILPTQGPATGGQGILDQLQAPPPGAPAAPTAPAAPKAPEPPRSQ